MNTQSIYTAWLARKPVLSTPATTSMKDVPRSSTSHVYLSNKIHTKITRHPNQLISRILSHFLKKDTMNMNEYEQLRGVFKTKFRSGNHGAVHSLQDYPKSWLCKEQGIYGPIVEDFNDHVRITPVWKEALHAKH